MTVQFSAWHIGLDDSEASELREELDLLVLEARQSGDFDDRKIAAVQHLRANLRRIQGILDVRRKKEITQLARKSPKHIAVFN